MKNKWLLGAVAASLVSLSVQAVPITGAIGFTGTYAPNNADLTLATSIAIVTAEVDTTTGSFVGIAQHTPVTFATPLSVNPASVSVPNLWTVGGFTFNLTGGAELPPMSFSLTLYGNGTLTGPVGYDPTPGFWTATFNTAGGSAFTWSSSTAGSVPDGGTTVMLLGAALSGLGLIRRKLAA